MDNPLVSNAGTLNANGLTFPGNLSANYYMSLMFYEYKRPSLSQGAQLLPNEVINLPIPVGLVDSQSVDYSEEPLGTALGSALEALPGWNVGEFMKGIVVGGAAGAAAALRVEGAVSAGFGITANPFLTIMFKAPKYRMYEFAWRLYPRNEQESETIHKIYSTIKYHVLPDVSPMTPGGSILTYPNMVRPVLYAGGNEWMLPYKFGVITNVVCNFAPDGTPSFHKNGEPSAVDFRIMVQEIEYFLRKDFQNRGA